jgi:hypothetical protein
MELNNEREDSHPMRHRYKGFKVFIISLAIIGSAFIIRDGLVNINKGSEFITVKGLAEQVVKADFAIWVIPVSSYGEEFDVAKDKINSDVEKIIKHLKKHEIEDSEITQDVMRIYDKMAQRYYDPNNKASRFAIDHQLIIKTNKVDAIQKASLSMNDVLQAGVMFSSEGYGNSYSAPKYLFTKLNDVKPEMLSAAMVEAKKAADQLLAPSGNKVGKIKKASQGMFTIYSREATGSGSGIDVRASYGGSNRYSSNEAYFIEKVLRVIANVEYYVE